MSDLRITDVTVEDKIDLLAKTCSLTLAPESKEAPPVAEFRYPGDSAQLTGTSLRPNGAILDVSGNYANIPEHVIFSGAIEFMDDMEDADKSIFHVQLSDMPQGQPHRKKLSTIFNQYNYRETTLRSRMSSHAILQELCDRLGIVFGRCDLPNYQVWGTFEVVRQTVVEVAQRLIGAFNTFDHTHYTIRCDRNGLQIIKIDFTKGGEVSNTYELGNILAKQRSFEMYMPDNRIGDSHVLITGADMYGKDLGGYDVIDGSAHPEDMTLSPNKPVVEKTTVTNVFKSDSKNTQSFGEGAPVTKEDWTENTTTVEYDIDTTFATGAQYHDFDINRLTWPVDQADTADSNDWKRFMDAYAEGHLLDISIVNTRTIKSEQASYNNISGLTSLKTTTYEYAQKFFKKHLWEGGVNADTPIPTPNPYLPPKTRDDRWPKVLISQETTSMLYVNGQEIPQSMDRTEYAYDEWGGNTSTTSKHYLWYRGAWLLQTVSVETASDQGALNSEIQWQAAEAQYRADQGQRAAERLMADASKHGPVTSTYTPHDPNAPPQSSPIGKYQLLDGQNFTSLPWNPGVGRPSPDPRATNPFVMAPALKNDSIWDPNNNFARREFELNSAFQMTQSEMDYTGLLLLWALAKTELELERKTAYWEVNKITASIDTSPVVGESIVIGGSSGIVESVTHILNGDEALTTVVVRRLIYDV